MSSFFISDILLSAKEKGDQLMGKNLSKKVVIVFLHNNFNSYLLQLRDFKSSIIYPGRWGAFGGAVEEGESTKVALGRELVEEIGYSPETINYFREVYKDNHQFLK